MSRSTNPQLDNKILTELILIKGMTVLCVPTELVIRSFVGIYK